MLNILLYLIFSQKIISVNSYSNFNNFFCNKSYLCCHKSKEFCFKDKCSFDLFYKIGLKPYFSETFISLELSGISKNNSDVIYYSICFKNPSVDLLSCVDLFYCKEFKNKFHIETSLYSMKKKLSKVDLARNFNVIDGVETYFAENYFQIFWLRKKKLNHSGIFFNLFNNTHELILMYGQASYFKNENKILKNNLLFQKNCKSVFKLPKYSSAAFIRNLTLKSQILFILSGIYFITRF